MCSSDLVEAQGHNPIADTLDEAQLRDLMQGTEAALVEQVRAMPRHIDFLQDFINGRAKEPV